MHAQCKSALTHRIYVQLRSNYSLLGTRQIGVKYEQEQKEALHFLYVSHRNMLVLHINTMRICYLCLMLLPTFRLSSHSKVQHILKRSRGNIRTPARRVQTEIVCFLRAKTCLLKEEDKIYEGTALLMDLILIFFGMTVTLCYFFLFAWMY